MPDIYRFAWPFFRAMDPEVAHRWAVRALRWGLVPGTKKAEDKRLSLDLWGLNFPNPIGLAAGFDKDGEVIAPLFGIGFGFVEIGTVTPKPQPRPQPGNPRPRLFRLLEDRAVINRMGFNSNGHEKVAENLRALRRPLAGPLGVNLGKNKESVDAADDYVRGVEKLGPFADYLVVNVSSPNTPGLRDLQGRAALEDLLGKVLEALGRLPSDSRPPLVLKIAPDLSAEDLEDIASVSLAAGLSGLAVSNTTLARPRTLKASTRDEAGGLSGRPLFEPSTEILAQLYRLTEGRIPLIGLGGVESGDTAYCKIRAGASLVQLYSALVYEGPTLVERIKEDLARCLERDGFSTLKAAIGADHLPS